MIQRTDMRGAHELRPLRVSYGIYPHADGSVLFEMGATRVLVGITLQQGVPPFLRGKNRGWLTAEYSLLPLATRTRVVRESSSGGKNGRSIEIARFIGRVFRSVVKLEACGERTILIDCDVLQADGGTRVAAINGVTLALHAAQERWLAAGTIIAPILSELVCAVSVGTLGPELLLDIDYAEDELVEADFTIVMTESGSLIELQGCAEKRPIPWEQYYRVGEMARTQAGRLFEFFTRSQLHAYLARHEPVVQGRDTLLSSIDR